MMNIFPQTNSEMLSILFLMFFTQKLIKTVIFNKTKHTCVCFFIYMCSMCAQIFTAFEVPVLKLYSMYLGECHKIKYGRHFHGNEPQGKHYFDFSPNFQTVHNKM